jgi:trehalose-phosphatase
MISTVLRLRNWFLTLARGTCQLTSPHCLQRVSHGKCVFEMSPALDWNKGKAVEYLMNKLGYADSSQCVAIYIGDDTSDEHAFKALGERGISILVSDVQKDTSARYHVKVSTLSTQPSVGTSTLTVPVCAGSC